MVTRDALRYVTLALLEHLLDTLGPDGGDLVMSAVREDDAVRITMTANVAPSTGRAAAEPGHDGTDPFVFAGALLRGVGGSVEFDDESTCAIRVRIPCRNDA
jgi:hypothetical protein